MLRRDFNASETLSPGTGTLTAVPGRRRYLGPGLGQAPLLYPRRCPRLRPPLPPFSRSGSGSLPLTRPSILQMTDRVGRPMGGSRGRLTSDACQGRGRRGRARDRNCGTCSSQLWEDPVASWDLGVGWSPLPARRSRAGNFLRPDLPTASPRIPGTQRIRRVAERWKRAEGCVGRIMKGKTWCE